MTDHESELHSKLSGLMRNRRTAAAEPMPREKFEEKFIEPLRRRSLWSSPIAWGFSGAVAFAAALFAFNLYWYTVPIGNPVQLRDTVSVVRPNFFFGERRLAVRQIYPGKDTIQFSGSGVTSAVIPQVARVSGKTASFSLQEHSARAISVQMQTGAAVFAFPKGESAARTLRIGEHDAVQITGTIVYADADKGIVAVLEGKTRLNGSLDFGAGQSYNTTTKTVTRLTEETRQAAESLLGAKLQEAPDKAAPAKELSLEEKIFRKYGNVHKVILKSGDTILAAKVTDAANGQIRLFTLSGPMYISESEISSVQRLR